MGAPQGARIHAEDPQWLRCRSSGGSGTYRTRLIDPTHSSMSFEPRSLSDIGFAGPGRAPCCPAREGDFLVDLRVLDDELVLEQVPLAGHLESGVRHPAGHLIGAD